jgi:cytochrome c-type biogenesis protein CcmF
MVLLAIGIAGSSAYQTIRESGHLRPGQSIEIAGYTATYENVTGVRGPNYTGFRSRLAVTGHGESFTVDPGMNTYGPKVSSNEVSIYHDPRTLGDFFATASLVNGKTEAIDLTLLVKPLINLIWAGGFLFVFGALVAMWPDAVEQRRLAARYDAGAAPAGV